MKASASKLRLSASDLSNHLACRHLTFLDYAVAIGESVPPTWHSPDLWVLQERGLEHEKAYIAHLAAQGLSVVDLRDTTANESNREVVEHEAAQIAYLAAEGLSVPDSCDKGEQELPPYIHHAFEMPTRSSSR
jgi:hypothetical protein